MYAGHEAPSVLIVIGKIIEIADESHFWIKFADIQDELENISLLLMTNMALSFLIFSCIISTIFFVNITSDIHLHGLSLLFLFSKSGVKFVLNFCKHMFFSYPQPKLEDYLSSYFNDKWSFNVFSFFKIVGEWIKSENHNYDFSDSNNLTNHAGSLNSNVPIRKRIKNSSNVNNRNLCLKKENLQCTFVPFNAIKSDAISSIINQKREHVFVEDVASSDSSDAEIMIEESNLLDDSNTSKDYTIPNDLTMIADSESSDSSNVANPFFTSRASSPFTDILTEISMALQKETVCDDTNIEKNIKPSYFESSSKLLSRIGVNRQSQSSLSVDSKLEKYFSVNNHTNDLPPGLFDEINHRDSPASRYDVHIEDDCDYQFSSNSYLNENSKSNRFKPNPLIYSNESYKRNV